MVSLGKECLPYGEVTLMGSFNKILFYFSPEDVPIKLNKSLPKLQVLFPDLCHDQEWLVSLSCSLTRFNCNNFLISTKTDSHKKDLRSLRSLRSLSQDLYLGPLELENFAMCRRSNGFNMAGEGRRRRKEAQKLPAGKFTASVDR